MGSFIRLPLLCFLLLVGMVFALSCLALVLASKYRRGLSGCRSELRERTAELGRQVERAEAAARTKGEFLSRMSHEIRTPLNAILGMAQLMRRDSGDTALGRQLGNMEDNSMHLMGIVNDILDFSKIESGRLVLEERCFSLRRDMGFLESMFEKRAGEKGISLWVELLDIGHDGIVADMLRLNQVLINLLSNAVKFTDAGGAVLLRAEELVHLAGESAYRFTVRDTGIGIDPEQAKKLFTPFTQANAGVSRLYGGTGLGLAISQSIVRMMGGDIELDTEPGVGTAFRFIIRVKAGAEAPEEQTPAARLPEKLRGKRVMIVDDVEINREIMAALLENGGVRIEMAANGKQALDAFLASEPHYYDLIFMDMLMPVADGCSATRGIRRSGRADAGDVRVIAMTASATVEDMERALASGMDGYLSKPIEMGTLYTRLEELL